MNSYRLIQIKRNTIFSGESEKYNVAHNLNAIIPYTTLRMRNITELSEEECANAIANHLQSSNRFMQDDPTAEKFRIETLKAIPQCLKIKRLVKSQLLETVHQKTKKKSISYWKWFKYNITLKLKKVRECRF